MQLPPLGTVGAARSGDICRKQRKVVGTDTSQPRSQYNECIVRIPRYMCPPFHDLSGTRADCCVLRISFLKMISVATAGGTVINYSSRFSIAGMTGVFPANVVAGIGAISGTAGPATENNVVQKQARSSSSIDPNDPYAVPYTLQTGLTKYAPMQPQPPTKITAQSATPLWPTSSVVFAMTWLPRPSQVTTSTQTPTYSVSSMENTVSPSDYFPICWLI